MKTKAQKQFVLCIRNKGCEDLEPRKVYPILEDAAATAKGLLRVIDESGEDYLYPADYFIAIDLPPVAVKALTIPS